MLGLAQTRAAVRATPQAGTDAAQTLATLKGYHTALQRPAAGQLLLECYLT